MQRQKKILFVINPISGGRKKTTFKKKAMEVLDLERFVPTFIETIAPNHAYKLGLEALEEGYDAVVAVGGDGTINELGSALVGSDIPLGIIPEGSGNGLALYLGIPLNEQAALKRLNRFETIDVDSGRVNGHPFFNMAGLGFDATVSDRFANDSIRGPIGYMRTIINVFGSYKPCRYVLNIDGVVIDRVAFMISVANSPQYGNNAYIAPNASASDGWLDVCIVHKFPLYTLPMMVFHLFNRSADQSEYVEIIRGKQIFIDREDSGPVHIDGEPLSISDRLDISIVPSSLKIIC